MECPDRVEPETDEAMGEVVRVAVAQGLEQGAGDPAQVAVEDGEEPYDDYQEDENDGRWDDEGEVDDTPMYPPDTPMAEEYYGGE